jgi:hypothetical protein
MLHEHDHLFWKRSTYCGTGACLEMAATPEAVFVRDAKRPASDLVLGFSPAAWQSFIGSVKANRLV